MKAIRSFFKLLFTALFFISISAGIAGSQGYTQASGIFAGLLLFTTALFIPASARACRYKRMGLQTEIWVKDIVEALFPNNSFAAKATSHDDFVLQGKVVHIPTAGAAATIKKNLTSFPQAATKRSDGELTYTLDTYYSLPRHLEDIEKYEYSYDKRQSILGQDQAKLINEAMRGLLYRWAPAASGVIETSGSAVAASLSGATGNRKMFTKDVLHDAKLAFDVADIASEGRVALLTVHHHQQFMNSLTDAERTGFNAFADLKRGIIGQYMGFEVMMRSTVLRYRKVAGIWTVVDEQDDAFAAEAADSAASLFWHPGAVARARGEVRLFDSPNQAEYYGDLISMNLRLGGRIMRTQGVLAAVSAAV